MHFCYSVISPELVMEVEARMKRNYMPPMLPQQRKHSRHAAKPHLPTVQELQGKLAHSFHSLTHLHSHTIIFPLIKPNITKLKH